MIKEDEDNILIELVDIIKRGYRNLSLLGIQKKISNTRTVLLIEEHLPKDIRREWFTRVNKDESSGDIYEKCPHFIHLLREQNRIILTDVAISVSEATNQAFSY